MQTIISMSQYEANQIAIFDKLQHKQLKQHKAAQLLGLSTRQVRRKLKKYKQYGATGLTHGNRGRKSNNQIDETEIKRALRLIEKQYHDFGPTLAWEKLVEFHQVEFSVERLRQAMIAEGVWQPKRRKRARIHQMRERRACEGELIQIDGSPHNWFERRGNIGICTLLVFIDDATGKLLHLEFVESETTWAYFGAMRQYLKNHGKPVAMYSDRHGVFRVNSSKGGSAAISDSNGLTQFGRAMKELQIEPIFANSPQAKGRVERANQTLQDRLIKEMRLKGLSNIEEANQYLPEFMRLFNQRFAVQARDRVNAHRPLLVNDNLDEILTIQETRVLSKNLTCQYQHLTYQIQLDKARTGYILRHAKVRILETADRSIEILYLKKKLKYSTIKQQPKAEVIDTKRLNQKVDKAKKQQTKLKPWRPSIDHPWKRPFLLAKQPLQNYSKRTFLLCGKPDISTLG